MTKSLQGQKVLLVVAPQGFAEDELDALLTAFGAASIKTVLASTVEGEATGEKGRKVAVVPIAEPRTDEFAGIVVVGGAGAVPHLAGNRLVHQTLRMIERDRHGLGAVGLGVAVLAKGGLLKGKKATAFVTPDMLHTLKDGGAHFEKRPVVIDGDIVTAEGGPAAGKLAAFFLDLLRQKNEAGTLPRHATERGASAIPSDDE